MDKEVILINPRMSKEPPKEKPLLPLAALALAGPLEQNGFTVRILDEYVVDVIDSLRALKSSPVCFGISCMMSYQIKSGLNIAREIRGLKPNVPIVWGGWFPTILPRLTVEDKNVDIVVKGKGEMIFLELVKALADQRPLGDIKGLVFKGNGQIHETPNRPLDDPNTFPRPPYHLLDLSRYCVSEGRINYTSSYGCPFRCRFCGITLGLHRKWNGGMIPERVLDEMEALVKNYGIKHVMFHEDNFCLNPERAKKILKGMVDRGLGLTWTINARADQMSRFDPELLKLLSAPAPSFINVGAESLTQRMLDFMEKDITVEQVTKVVHLSREYDIPLNMNIMAGIPTETPAEYMETLRKLKSYLDILPKMQIQIFAYGPMPGTALYEFEKQQGRVQNLNSLEDWANATEDLGFSPFDFYRKVARYSNRIFRVMTFYFGCAYIYPSWVKKAFGPALRALFEIVSLLGALRFRFAFWALPFEWGTTRLLRGFLKLVKSY